MNRDEFKKSVKELENDDKFIKEVKEKFNVILKFAFERVYVITVQDTYYFDISDYNLYHRNTRKGTTDFYHLEKSISKNRTNIKSIIKEISRDAKKHGEYVVKHRKSKTYRNLERMNRIFAKVEKENKKRKGGFINE